MEIHTYTTFYKKNTHIQKYYYIDGTLGIRYSVEPTLKTNGFYGPITINDTNTLMIPLSIDDVKPKLAVQKFIEKEKFYQKYTICVYHVWYVRQEKSTKCIDVYFK